MNAIFPTFCSAAVLLCSSVSAQTVQDSAGQVNPLIGTGISAQLDFGNVSPGATLPFGMLYWSPDPVSGQFYNYREPVTRGFSLTHLSGPGCGVFGDLPILPLLGTPQSPPPVQPMAYRAAFSHADETAEPGYYAVRLDSGIRVELAAQRRAGIARFTYPADASLHTVLLDLSRNLTAVDDAHLDIRGQTITGSIASGGFCSTGNLYKIYFAMQVDALPAATGAFDEMQIYPARSSTQGPRTGAYLAFSPATTTVNLKVGLSYVSVDNAAMNLEHEIPGWSLDQVRRDARETWNRMLHHAQVAGGTPEQRTVFYTALYHALLHPSVFSDVNGEYIGFDNKIRRAEGRVQYANFSGWDIYRSQVQLIAMLLPDVGSDLAASLIADAQQGGGLPIWPVANDESGVMAGDPSDPIIASIYAFGGRNFDTEAAMAAMLHGATDRRAHIRLYAERPGLAEYLNHGYMANTEDTGGAASVTLEDTTADFAIAAFARALGDTRTEHQFLTRSAYWRNIFDPQSKYIRPRGADGNFLSGFDPGKMEGFVEGNAAQYTWMVPYDLKGVVDAVGGPKAAEARLDDYFSQYGSTNRPGPYFFIGNEPSFGNPWIYNWAGSPWRTQEVVRKTLRDLFDNSPAGLPGNDDLGATSSWVVFASLGLYPEIPGVGGVTVNSPIFPEVKLLLGDHLLRIVAPGAPDELYVKSLALDDSPIHNWWLDWSRLSKGRELVFTLTAAADKGPGSLPPSYPAPKADTK
jgi:predicted alpha-1,2-mannosidase